MTKSEILERVLRSVVTLAFTFGVIYGFLIDKVSAEAFIGFVGMVLSFWFSQRAGQRERASDATSGNGTPSPASPAP